LWRAGSIVPRWLRDFVYDRIAQNRYRLFGRTETCMVPAPEVAGRFVFSEADAAKAFAGRPSPFQALLGADYSRLPDVVRRVHAPAGSLTAAGRAEANRGRGFFAALLCHLAGLPAAGRDIPVTVTFHADGPLREFWQRRFAERRYASTLGIDARRAPGLLVERFGPFAFEFRLQVQGEPPAARLCWSLAGCRLLGIRIPRRACPRIACTESADGERFAFDIDVAFPLVGPVIHYSGWLAADAPGAVGVAAGSEVATAS
jgi:hypothetical protein